MCTAMSRTGLHGARPAHGSRWRRNDQRGDRKILKLKKTQKRLYRVILTAASRIARRSGVLYFCFDQIRPAIVYLSSPPCFRPCLRRCRSVHHVCCYSGRARILAHYAAFAFSALAIELLSTRQRAHNYCFIKARASLIASILRLAHIRSDLLLRVIGTMLL